MATKSIVFVSYSHEDKDIALGLTKELQALGANIWIDQIGIKLGQHWDNTIEEALEEAGTLMVLISNNSVTSPNVQDEVSIAINDKKRIVPILIEQCELPMRWRRLQYADFISDPEKSLNDVLEALEIQRPQGYIADKIKSILKSLKHGNADLVIPKPTDSSETTFNNKDIEKNKEALLISEPEMDRATLMYRKVISKNKILIISTAVASLFLMTILLFITKTEPTWLVILGSLILNLLSIKPIGNINKSFKRIELIDLLKLKRQRLIRIIADLDDEEMENFNQEFTNYISH
ncbi:toll/interleukin-1 receptor domain-containing protein [Aegicerativicinus sediminis]|uniref:toll/interleukin-1 receptor domain-containing protein n=1 Tax=Aegicerativicinus sediminis TaxID=2893202 RepID=UPI001E578974|nr:toll/interleukin-1 receptor domain-containing protein [Aegicerativicinus sediminis]